MIIVGGLVVFGILMLMARASAKRRRADQMDVSFFQNPRRWDRL